MVSRRYFYPFLCRFLLNHLELARWGFVVAVASVNFRIYSRAFVRRSHYW